MGRLIDAIMDTVFLIGVIFTISKSIRSIVGGKQSSTHSKGGRGRKQAASSVQGQTIRDPECGMFVSTEVSHKLVHGNEVLHFCSEECIENYEKRMAKV